MAATSPEILAEQPSGRTRRADANHINGLTGFRGFAALVVLVVHGAGHTAYPGVGLRGYGPVALFVLSGYLLVSPWSKWSLSRGPRPDIATFFKRRISRIFPAYLAVLLAVAVIYPASRPKGDASWARALTLTNWLQPDGLRPAMEHLWSMNTEFSWYFALPVIGLLLAVLGRRMGPGAGAVPMLVILAVSVAITALWIVWLQQGDHGLAAQLTYPMWLPNYLACFVAGATVRHFQLVAGQSLRPSTAHRLRFLPIVVAVGAVALILSPLSGPAGWVTITSSERTIRFVAATFLALSLLIVTVTKAAGSPVRRVFELPPMVALGRWSYGTYLWHLPLTTILAENMTVPSGVLGFIAWILLLVALSAGFGALTYVFIERPIIAWSKGTSPQRA